MAERFVLGEGCPYSIVTTPVSISVTFRAVEKHRSFDLGKLTGCYRLILERVEDTDGKDIK